jgi:predicted nucleic acid-binding protein
MDRLFLDANILFSAAYQPNAGLLRLWKLKNVALCSSRYALEEARINLADDDQQNRLTKLSESLHLFEARPMSLPSGIFLPEKDLPILFGAIEARASHLLTGDVRHFHAYFGKKIQGIAIMRPGDYLRMLAR